MNTATRITLLLCLLMLPFAAYNAAVWFGLVTDAVFEPLADVALTVLPWLAGIWFVFGRGGCCSARRCRPARSVRPTP